ncbi:lasso RiPP family leader peptide-containing protein [Streptomyces chrestomyceticus]
MRQEARDVEQAEYEPPELVEAGEFSELTLGFAGYHWDGFGGFFGE